MKLASLLIVSGLAVFDFVALPIETLVVRDRDFPI